MQEWTGGHEAALSIYEFFKTKVNIWTGANNEVGFEGKVGRFFLMITTFTRRSENRDTMRIWLLNAKTFTDRGGVMLNNCKGIDFMTDENGHKCVIIYAENGEAEIDASGVHATIYPKSENYLYGSY